MLTWKPNSYQTTDLFIVRWYQPHKRRIRTPKHILLPLTIHNITRSKKAVTLLSQFGYGIGYTELEAQTATKEHHLKRTSEGEAFIPSKIDPSCRVGLYFDNNDICEEIISGFGTTHCTNGIMIQND